jgi:hypothetical protein
VENQAESHIAADWGGLMDLDRQDVVPWKNRTGGKNGGGSVGRIENID